MLKRMISGDKGHSDVISAPPNIFGWLSAAFRIPIWGVVIAVLLVVVSSVLVWRHWIRSATRPPRWIVDECDQLRFQIRIRDWELGLTRRFLGTRELTGRLQLLMESLVPNSQAGFAAIFRLNGRQVELENSVGLHPETTRKLQMSAHLVEETVARGSLALSAQELSRSRSVVGFSTYERSRLTTLYCLRLGNQRQPWGLLITSELPAIQPGEAASLSGWEHLTSILGEELASQESLTRQGDELAFTREMLELRSLADQQFRSPSHLLQEFMRRLAEMTDFDRTTLVLNEDEQQICNVPRLRSGGPLSRDLLFGWERSEDRLLADSSGASNSSIWTEQDLVRIGIQGPFSTAVIIPLRHHEWVMGQLYLTRRSTGPILDSHRKLIGWGAKYLVELIARTVDRATIELQAKRDGLTQLANRMTLDLELDRAMDRANRLHDDLSLILLDLDHFKAVNDTYGHLGGDAALKTVARIVERSVHTMRDGDQPLVARYGGEELAVLLPGVGEAGSRRIAESIREAVRRTPILFDGLEFHITLSAGVATRGGETCTSRSLISASDVALYRAKANGRNRVEVTVGTQQPTLATVPRDVLDNE